METATQEAQGRVHGLAGPFLSLSSSAEEDGGAGGYGRRDGGLKAWYLLNFFFGLEEEEAEEEKEEEDEDELVSWDDVVVSGCGSGSGGLGNPPHHVGCHSWFLGSGICRAGRCPCCAGRVPCPVCASGPCWALSGYRNRLVVAFLRAAARGF